MQVRPSWMERVMLGRLKFFLLLIAVAGSPCLFADSTRADSPAVKFDAPALIAVSHGQRISDSLGHLATDLYSTNEKLIQVVIPVSSEVRHQDRGNVTEFRFDVFWNRNAYPITSYGPQTKTLSKIEGLISVEKVQERNNGFGLDLKSGYQDVVSGTATAELSNKTGTKLQYQEVPKHEVLIASGTVRRGTGAFFRFHPSRQHTLEGGRDLVVIYRVPRSWRGGVLKIECRADGERKVIGSWREPFQESRSFVVPIYLDGDDQAREAAMSFAQAEQNLRSNWQQHVERGQKKQANSLLGLFNSPSSQSNLPKQWMHYLIQSGNDVYLTRYRSQLPKSVAVAAEDFVSARQGLLKLSR